MQVPHVNSIVKSLAPLIRLFLVTTLFYSEYYKACFNISFPFTSYNLRVAVQLYDDITKMGSSKLSCNNLLLAICFRFSRTTQNKRFQCYNFLKDGESLNRGSDVTVKDAAV